MDKLFRWFGLPGSVVLTALMSFLALARALLLPTPARWLCFAAMALSSIGDLFLGHLKFLTSHFRHCFEIGVGFFMASHIMYALCYSVKSLDIDAPIWNAGAAAAFLFGILAASVLAGISFRHNRTKNLPLVLIYLCAITLNCATVFSYAWSQRLSSFSSVFAAVGVFSFMLSDFIIGLGLTGKIHRYDALTWWFYPIGQILLILGV